MKSIKIISWNERGCRDGKLVKMIVTRHCYYCSVLVKLMIIIMESPSQLHTFFRFNVLSGDKKYCREGVT